MLFDAVQEGNLPQALVALGKGANVNWRSYDKVFSDDAITSCCVYPASRSRCCMCFIIL